MPPYYSDKGEYRSPWAGEPGPSHKAPKELPKTSGPRLITPSVLVGLIFLVLGGLLAFFYYLSHYKGGQADANVAIEFSKPSGQVLLGQPFILPVSFANNSDKVLKTAHVSLILPDGVSFLGQSQGQRVMDQSIGDLGPGSISQQAFNLIATDGAQTVKHFQAKLSYTNDANGGNQFDSTGDTDVLIGQPAVTLTFATPSSIFNGQDFDIKVTYQNNLAQDLKNLHFKMNYPPVFHFKRASVAPENDANNSWNLGILPASANGSFTITGNVVGPERSFFDMSGTLAADFLGETYALNTQSASLAISSSPLSISIDLQGGSDYVSHARDSLNYVLHYKNNSSVVFQDVNIRANLIGEMYDFSTFSSNGVFASPNTVQWMAANTPALANLPPGGDGEVHFVIQTKGDYPIRLISDKNFTLKVHAQIDSPTIPPNTTADRTVSVADAENKVKGKVALDMRGYWRDAQSGILNTGPYPPRVNQTTQYTVHWIVTNYATDVSNAIVTAYLQNGARFTGKVKSNTDSVPTYNPNSGLVTWQIGNIPATRGVSGVSAPLETVFQIEQTPSMLQKQTSVTLVSNMKLTAQDVFTGEDLSDDATNLTTDLPDDTTVQTTNRGVRP